MDLSEFLAGIMQSVNSTLGTLNFKPLDKIIKNMFIESNHVSETGVGATIFEYANEITAWNDSAGERLIAKFIAPVTGFYKINIDVSSSIQTSNDVCLMKSIKNYKIKYDNTLNDSIFDGSLRIYEPGFSELYMKTSIGSTVSRTFGSAIDGNVPSKAPVYEYVSPLTIGTYNEFETQSRFMFFTKDEPVFLVIIPFVHDSDDGTSYIGGTIKCKNIVITYEPFVEE